MTRFVLGNPSQRSPVRVIRMFAAAWRTNAFSVGDIDGTDCARAIGRAAMEADLCDPHYGDPVKVGQKVRTQMVRLGLVRGRVEGAAGPWAAEWNRKVGQITPVGSWAAESAWDIAAEERVLTSIFGVHRCPSPTDQAAKAGGAPVWPLRHIMRVVVELEKLTASTAIDEACDMRLSIQLSGGRDPAVVAADLLDVRRAMAAADAATRKRTVSALAASTGLMAGSLRDYSDTTMRHLEATGLMVATPGGRFVVNPPRRREVEALCATPDVALPAAEHMAAVESGWVAPVR
jgi:hypothetical protein